jgi:lipoyl(octanoyl) transferase
MPQWKISNSLVDYGQAHKEMEERVAHIHSGDAEELVWLLEHPPLYTGGTSANHDDLLAKDQFPVYQTGRGGEYTYHGPGQRIAYVMLDLAKRNSKDIKKYIYDLEQWIINSLAAIGIKGERRDGRVGIWVSSHGTENKIAAIGIRVRKWITFHGIAINLNPDLSHFGGIVPCGISKYGVTSIKEMGFDISMGELNEILKREFTEVFRVI